MSDLFTTVGFDSPEVQAQLAEAFAQWRAAFDQIAEVCRRAAQIIAEAIAPIIRAVVRWWRQVQHLMPRQYRMTMQRRKLRRAAVLGCFALRQ